MSTFTRPTHNTSWYGYTRATTKPTPVRLTPDAEPTAKQVRVDVFVREFLSVKVKELKESSHEGRGGASPVSVVFDGSSVVTGSEKKLKHDFGASLVAGSRIHDCLKDAHANGTPLYVAIETKRRYKSKGGEVIPYTTPMHVLRGSQPDGSKANSNITGENCSNVIAVVGLADNPEVTILSDEAVTDPTTWDAYRHNRDGSMPPEGWQHVYGDDGERAGAIIQAEAPPAAAGADASEIAKQVAALLGGTGNGQGQARTGFHAARSVEGKPWEERNSDGRINPAGPMVQSVRWARRDALEMLKDAIFREDAMDQFEDADLSKAATTLIEPLMWAACKVQNAVLGYSRKSEPSYREAARWVSQVAGTDVPYQLSYLEDRDGARAWVKEVAEVSAELYTLALQIAEKQVAAEQGPGVPQVDTSADGAAQATAARNADTTAERTAQASGGEVGDDDDAETLADRPDLQGKWDELIEKLNMAEHIDLLNPILVKNFGTHFSDQIPADRFERMVTAGLDQPAKFWEAAKAAAQTTG